MVSHFAWLFYQYFFVSTSVELSLFQLALKSKVSCSWIGRAFCKQRKDCGFDSQGAHKTYTLKALQVTLD